MHAKAAQMFSHICGQGLTVNNAGAAREQVVLTFVHTVIGGGCAVRNAKAVLMQWLCSSSLTWVCSALKQAAATATLLAPRPAWQGATDTPPQILILQFAAGFTSTSWGTVLWDIWTQCGRQGCTTSWLSAAKVSLR